MMHPTAIWDRPCSSPEAERLRLAHKAFTLGLLARLIDMPISACPFGARSYEADAWENGWGTIDVHLSGRESVAEAEHRSSALALTPDDLSLLRTIVEQYRESAAEWHLDQSGSGDYEANKAKSDEVYEKVGELLAKLDGPEGD